MKSIVVAAIAALSLASLISPAVAWTPGQPRGQPCGTQYVSNRHGGTIVVNRPCDREYGWRHGSHGRYWGRNSYGAGYGNVQMGSAYHYEHHQRTVVRRQAATCARSVQQTNCCATPAAASYSTPAYSNEDNVPGGFHVVKR